VLQKNPGELIEKPAVAALLVPRPVLEICTRLRDAGFEAFAVGGAVRDMLLNRGAADWDIATSATVDQVESLFPDSRKFTANYRTITLIFEGSGFEITPFRGSQLSIESDLTLRDFTIDAIALEPEKGTLLDPGSGIRDLKKRIIRCVGDPLARFHEDPLRLLRAVRISAQLRFRIEDATREALSQCAPLLARAAPERIRDELPKILMTQEPVKALRLLLKTGLLSIILPEMMEGYRRRQSPPHRHTILEHALLTVGHTPSVLHLRIAALLHDVAKPGLRTRSDRKYHFYGHEKRGAEIAADILDRLRFGNVMRELVTSLITNHMIVYDSGWSDGAVRRLIARTGKDRIKDLLALKRADVLAQDGEENRDNTDELQRRIDSILSKAKTSGLEPLRVSGRDVMEALGIGPGPKVGAAMAFLKEKVLDDPFVNSRDSLMEILLGMKNSRTYKRI